MLARRIANRLAAVAGSLTMNPDGTCGEADSALGNGLPGIALALLYATDVLQDESLLRSGQRLLRRAAEATAGSPMTTAGLYSGTAGFAWVLAEFTRREPRYRKSLRSTATRLAEQVSTLPRVEPGEGIPQQEYDVIAGAAGQLATLARLAQVLEESPGDPVVTAAESLVEYLARVTGTDGAGRPHWYVAPRFYPAAFPWYRECFPHGMYNLGVAHGMPGVLAALCAAAEAGLSAAIARDRVGAMASWLAGHQLDEPGGPGWAPALSADPVTRAPVFDPGQEPGRAAWCYGTPGVAITLFSAADVLAEPGLAAVAGAALDRVTRSSAHERQAFAPTLCHGQAGLLMIGRRAHAWTGADRFLVMQDECLRALAEAADERNTYVFADEPAAGKIVQNPGMLTGAAGILLALCGTASPAAAGWDDVFFLAPGRQRVSAAAGRPGRG
jgi:lantibiotic modifying enzyme